MKRSKKKMLRGSTPLPYKITYGPLHFKGERQLTDQDMSMLEDLHDLTMDSPKKAIEPIKKAISLHPDLPQLYNYLYTATVRTRGVKKGVGILMEMREKFPDYLFGKLNYAIHCINNNKMHEIPVIFNNKFDLRLIYPERNVFHISEVTGFCQFLALYYMKLDNYGAAMKNLKQLRALNADPDMIEELEENMIRIDIRNSLKALTEAAR